MGDTMIPKLLTLLYRVPLWLWLFIAMTQVLIVTARYYDDLPRTESLVEEFSNDPALAQMKARLEKIDDRERRDFIGGLSLGTVSIGLAYWKWSSTRPWARRFSLGTLLIATTLIAVVLGTIIALRR
jgi:hypothetical protein